MSDIKTCSDENTAKPSDIVKCDEDQTPKPQDIKICEDDDRLDPCPTAGPLSITGDGDCNVGDFYSGGGGIGPYSYSFSAGSINSVTGEILSISGCGAPGTDRFASVSVSDSCGSAASLEVRLPGGTWVLVGTDTGNCTNGGFASWTDSSTSGCRVCDDPFSCDLTVELISGGNKYSEDWDYITISPVCDGHGCDTCSGLSCNVPASTSYPYTENCPADHAPYGGTGGECVQTSRSFQWQCP